MKEIRINKYLLLISMILLMNLNVFYLLPDLPFKQEDLTLGIELLFTFYVYYRNRRRVTYRYKWLMLFPLLFVVTSSIMAYINYNQPIFMGIRAQRHWIGALLMYFPLTKLFMLEKIHKEELFKMVDYSCIILFILCMLQSVLGFDHLFMNVLKNVRYGGIRLYICVLFYEISYFYHLVDFLYTKKIPFYKNIFYIVITLMIFIIIYKSRMAFLVLVLGSAITVLMMQTTRKKFIVTALGIGILIAFLSSSMGSDIINTILNNENVLQDTSTIREAGKTFFMQGIRESLLNRVFGKGFVNIDWPQAYYNSGYASNYFIDDNGIIGLIFYYGYSFALWMFVITFIFVKDAFEHNQKLYITYFIYSILGIYSLYPTLYYDYIAYALMLAMLNKEVLTTPVAKKIVLNISGGRSS